MFAIISGMYDSNSFDSEYNFWPETVKIFDSMESARAWLTNRAFIHDHDHRDGATIYRESNPKNRDCYDVMLIVPAHFGETAPVAARPALRLVVNN